MTRLDSETVKRNIVNSRERAKMLIKSGSISVNGKVCYKPSYPIEPDDIITLSGEDLKYVGRGGLKLEKALDTFKIELSGCICLDIGASTGGFTDCMLQRGAVKVFAVDVGHNQLSEKLKSDKRVINLEGCDIRNLSLSDFKTPVDFISIDVSFISLRQIIPKAVEFLKQDGIISALIKPQFEAGKKNIGKNGIVRDKKIHIEVLRDTEKFLNNIGLFSEYTFSPVKGGSGNIEYLVKLTKSGTIKNIDFKSLVDEAFKI